MNPNKEIRQHFLSSVLPALCFGALSGVASGAVVTLYKAFAKRAVSLSHLLYDVIGRGLWHWLLPLALAGILAFFLSRIYRKEPDLQGGGIPASVGALRGLFPLAPWKNAVGSFFLSLFAFLFGVPLGTEGPGVQLGTALGAGVARLAPKRHRAWERFSMTGGAASGFAVATGAPISGVFFAIEEAHGRISPLIVLTSVTSIFAALFTSSLLSPLLGVEVALFDLAPFSALTPKALWIPAATGVTLGLFSLLFYRFYEALAALFRKAKALPQGVLIFGVVVATLIAGVHLPETVSTGHDLVHRLLEAPPEILLLLVILVLRSALTLSANLSGITGGIFLPLLAIGGTLGGLLFRVFGGESSLWLAFSIVGCIAGMMKMPLTAILFGVEALGLSQNALATVLCAATAFALPAALGEDSIGERVLERRMKRKNQGKEKTETEFPVILGENSFAVGKEIRDIFWPDGVRVLSVQRSGAPHKLLQAGDTLLIRLSSCDPVTAREQLDHICQ